MIGEKFDNICFALEDCEADAINMTMRSGLMTSIEKAVAAWSLPRRTDGETQREDGDAQTGGIA